MPSAASKTRSKTRSKENRRCEWELLLLTSFVIPSTAETGRVIHPRATVMVFETVEILLLSKNAPKKAPCVMGSDRVKPAIRLIQNRRF